MSQSSVFGHNETACIQKPIDNSVLSYVNQLNGIIIQLDKQKNKQIAIERLKLLLQEITLMRDSQQKPKV